MQSTLRRPSPRVCRIGPWAVSIAGHTPPILDVRPAVGDVVNLQHRAVRDLRDLVRAVEKDRSSADRPNPDFERLHDLARHAIDVIETLDLATNTADGLLAPNRRVSGLVRNETGLQGFQAAMSNRLLFFLDMLHLQPRPPVERDSARFQHVRTIGRPHPPCHRPRRPGQQGRNADRYLDRFGFPATCIHLCHLQHVVLWLYRFV